MADRPGGPHVDEQVSEPVLDWLDEIAEAEGLSWQTTVETLVSSYWRLGVGLRGVLHGLRTGPAARPDYRR